MSRPERRTPIDRDELLRLLIFRVEEGAVHIIRTLGEHYGGCFTHWAKGRTYYCPGDGADCQFHKTEKIWKGYAPAELYRQDRNLWAPIVLEISEHLELDLRDRWDRGQVWELTRAARTKKTKATPVMGKLLEERDPTTFPPAFSVQEVLRTRYHVPQVILDKKNPLPPRVFLPCSAGDAPSCLSGQADSRPTSAEELAKFRQQLAERGIKVNGNGVHP